LMRKVPSSVAVITVTSFDTDLGRNVPMGVAVSSLSTVTLDPPTISFNIKQPSKTLDAIRAANGRFRVYFPAADRGGAAIVELFCRGNHPDAYKLRTKELKIYVPGYGSHAESTRDSASRAPQIFSDSVRAALECSLTHELSVADHVILVAKVDSLESKALGDRTILYVDGAYMRPDGTRVTSHGRPTVGTEEDAWTAWDYPLFPGEEERRDYMERIKTIVAGHSTKLKPGKETIRELERTLALSPGAWGINLEKLVDECRQEAGKPSELPAHLKDSSVLSDFYGRLTLADRAKLIQRAKHFVKEDPRFLSLNYRVFLQHLGASTSIIDFLPSDMLSSLRADGLVGPFQPRVGSSSLHTRDHNLEYLEQVQHRLEEHFATLSHEEAVRSRLDDIMESLGEPKSVATYFKKSRSRLYAAASPMLYFPSKFDIAGEVSPEEARVIMSRAIQFLQIENIAIFRKNLNVDVHEALRLIGVHPSITGFNVEFFFGKIRHLYFSTRFSRDVVARVEKTLKPHFTSTIPWENLEERVRSFVQKMPMRAMSWSNRDKLAAMGLSWEATLTVPTSKEEQPLNRGHILDTLVAKELKSLHGNSTEELNQAIAHYLKDQYNYDIHPKPTQQSLAEAQTRSSGDDMQEAMMASRNVNVLNGNINRGTNQRRTTAGPRIRAGVQQAEQNDNRRMPAAGPRIRAGLGNGSSLSDGGRSTLHKQPTPSSSLGSWTGYSLGGEKKGD
jgi:flavin reductase (DIM6/NTAB) family NADH-FMN oxidoreductase RutF